MKRIALQLTQNPFTDDKIGSLTFNEAYQQVKMFCEDILALLETDITDYELSTPIIMITKISLVKLHLPEKTMRQLITIYKIAIGSKGEVAFFAEKVEKKKSVILRFVKNMYDIWKQAPEKKEHIIVGKMRVHLAWSAHTKKDEDIVTKAFEIVNHVIASTKIPFFKDAFYGDYLITSPNALSAYGKYHSPSDSIFLDSILIKEGSVRLAKVVIHETCHRYYRTVLSSQEKEEWGLFYEETKLSLNSSSRKGLPQIGDSLYWKYGIALKDPKSNSTTIGGKDLIHKIDDSSYPTKYYFRYGNRKEGFVTYNTLHSIGLFPTNYSQKNQEEFFCEIIPMHLMGKLAEPLNTYFEEAIKKRFIDPYDVQEVLTKARLDKLFFFAKRDIAEIYYEQAMDILNLYIDISTKDQKDLAKEYIHYIDSFKKEGVAEPWMIPKSLIEELQEAYIKCQDELYMREENELEYYQERAEYIYNAFGATKEQVDLAIQFFDLAQDLRKNPAPLPAELRKRLDQEYMSIKTIKDSKKTPPPLPKR